MYQYTVYKVYILYLKIYLSLKVDLLPPAIKS